MIIVGIDSGMKGGISVYAEPIGKFIDVIPMPIVTKKKGVKRNQLDMSKLATYFEQLSYMDSEIYVFLEDIMAFSQRNAFATLNFGKEWGKLFGVLSAILCEPILIRSQVWKKHTFPGLKTKDMKQLSVDKCKELYPDVNLLSTPRCKKESDGMAEACLIARYGLSVIKQNKGND